MRLGLLYESLGLIACTCNSAENYPGSVAGKQNNQHIDRCQHNPAHAAEKCRQTGKGAQTGKYHANSQIFVKMIPIR